MATELERLIVRIEADVSRLRSGLRDAERQTGTSTSRMQRSFGRLGRGLVSVTRSVSSLRTALVGLGALTVATAATRNIIRQGDAYSLLLARLRLVTAGEQELNRVELALFESAQRNRIGFEATAELYTRLARSSEQLGLSQDELLGITETINQALVVSGATGQEASAGLIQFAQGLASGALRGDELRSVLEQLPRLARAIADGLGITVGQLRDLGSEGELSAERVLAAIQTQAAQINEEFRQIDRTVGQATSQLANSFLRAAGLATSASEATEGLTDAIDQLREIVDSPGFQTGLQDVLTFFVGMVSIGASTVEAIGDITDALGRLDDQLRVIVSRGLADLGLPGAEQRNEELRRRIGLLPERQAGVTIPLPPPPAQTRQVNIPPPGVERPSGIQDLVTQLENENAQLRLQTELFGQSTEEIDRQLQLLEIRQELGDVAAERASALVRENASLTTELERQLETQREQEAALERIIESEVVLSETQDTLADQATVLQNAFADVGFVATSAFEDAILAGESLSDVLQGLEQDLLRVLLRALVLDPITQGIQTGLQTFGGTGGGGGLTGLIAGGIGAAANLFPSPVPGLGLGQFNQLSAIAAADIAANPLIFHGGGIVGSTSVPRRTVSTDVFRDAPRMHNGGIAGLRPDEVPAILQEGETVRRRGASAGDGGPPVLEVHMHGVRDGPSLQRTMPQFRGQMTEFLERAKRDM